MRAAVLLILKGKGEGEVEPPWETLVPQQVTVPAQMTPRHVMTKRWPRWPVANAGPSACCAGLVESD